MSKNIVGSKKRKFEDIEHEITEAFADPTRLEFLVDCSTKKEEPDRNEWNEDLRILYWKHKRNEQDQNETRKLEKQEEFEKGRKEGIEEGIEEGVERGKLKGEIKGEISKIKSLLKHNVFEKEIINDLKFLNKDEFVGKLDSNLQYIRENLEQSDSDICDELGLLGGSSLDFDMNS